MSIINININKKIEVLLRLIDKNETLKDASSKAGLSLSNAKNILNNINTYSVS